MTSQPTARVVVASTRAAAGIYQDRTGPIIVNWLRDQGYQVDAAVVVPDGEPVAEVLRGGIRDRVAVLITTGGTGLTPTDRTPEVTKAVLDYEIPGLANAIRTAGLPKVPTSVLSRGVAGVAGRTLVVNLPGSTGGVRDGLDVLSGVLAHAIDQLHGEDHGTSALVSTAEVVVARAVVSENPLLLEEHIAIVTGPQSGAVVSFSGVVRNHDHGQAVRELEYVGHPSASDVLSEIATQVAARHPGTRALAVSHRLGLLGIGDLALACAVSAEHRKAAFITCAELVDEIKARLPVWKRQVFMDGTEEWVNCP